MQERYSDDQLAAMGEAAAAIKKMCAAGVMYDLFRGKVLLLEDEIAREEKTRADERAAAEAAALAEVQKNENPPT